jgi:hypothetical protein
MEMHPDGSRPLLELGAALDNLVKDQAEWSQTTFGSDTVRGPIGALRHLAKEASEAEVEARSVTAANTAWSFKLEMADCLLLVLDAARRGGVTPRELIDIAQTKMGDNRKRRWPTPVADQPVEHVQE